MSLLAQQKAGVPDMPGLSLPVLNFYDFLPAAQIPAIQARTSTYDCDGAFASAIDALPTAGGCIWIGPGKFSFGGSVPTFSKTIRLIGCGNGAGGSKPPTLLQVPINCNGITFAQNVPGSIVEALAIQGVQAGATLGDAITYRSRGTLRNVDFHYFGRYGIRVDPALSLGENCNNFQIDACNVSNCNSHGYFANGQDSNAGRITALSVKNCLGWGVYDSSFLGNTFTACHTAGNVLGGYKTDGANANNVFVGCYAESGQGSGNSFVTQTLILGGTGMGSISPVLQVLGNRQINNAILS